MVTPPNPPTLDLEAEPERCDRCAWPLKERAKDGCVSGNCSQRPIPPERTIFSRAEYLAMRNRRDRAVGDLNEVCKYSKALHEKLMAQAHDLERLKAEAAELRIEIAGRSAMFAELLQIHEVLAPYKTEGGSYLDAAAKLDAEIQAARERIAAVGTWARYYAHPSRGMGESLHCDPPLTISAARQLLRMLAIPKTPAASESEEP
jgi:hypothetical protein